MPVLLTPLLIKFVLPFLLQELVKSGVLSELEAGAITNIGDLVKWIGSLKTYQQYPDQKSKFETNKGTGDDR